MIHFVKDEDILKFGDVKCPELLDRIVRALAFQIGQEVVYSELAQTVGTDDKTVVKCIDILDRAYIVNADLGVAALGAENRHVTADWQTLAIWK